MRKYINTQTETVSASYMGNLALYLQSQYSICFIMVQAIGISIPDKDNFILYNFEEVYNSGGL